MKKIVLLISLLTCGFISEPSFSQNSSANNIESQPMWGPVGYNYVDYYYLPDIETYYSVEKHKFIYLENGLWINRYALPERLLGYDVYNAKVIVINEPSPYLQHNEHWAIYPWIDEGTNQQIIRDSYEVKYMINKNHPRHEEWVEMKKNERRNSWRRTGNS